MYQIIMTKRMWWRYCGPGGWTLKLMRVSWLCLNIKLMTVNMVNKWWSPNFMVKFMFELCQCNALLLNEGKTVIGARKAHFTDDVFGISTDVFWTRYNATARSIAQELVTTPLYLNTKTGRSCDQRSAIHIFQRSSSSLLLPSTFTYIWIAEHMASRKRFVWMLSNGLTWKF